MNGSQNGPYTVSIVHLGSPVATGRTSHTVELAVSRLTHAVRLIFGVVSMVIKLYMRR